MRLAVPPSASPKRPPTGPLNTGTRSSSRPLSPLFSSEARSAAGTILSGQDEKASLDLSVAVRTMDTQLRAPGTPEQPDFPTFTSAKDRSQAAQKQFQAIIDKYPHTRTADMAHYFLAVTEKNLGDNAAAERNFKEVISKANKEVGLGRQGRPRCPLRRHQPHQGRDRALPGTDQQADHVGQQSNRAASAR